MTPVFDSAFFTSDKTNTNIQNQLEILLQAYLQTNVFVNIKMIHYKLLNRNCGDYIIYHTQATHFKYGHHNNYYDQPAPIIDTNIDKYINNISQLTKGTQKDTI